MNNYLSAYFRECEINLKSIIHLLIIVVKEIMNGETLITFDGV